MDAAQKLRSLYEIIDRNASLKKGKNEGPFSFLGEDMMIRYVTTTPNRRAGIEGLKTYLAKDILQINCGKDYVTYKNILDNLEGTSKKKYQVDSRRLEDCFDREKNRTAIEEDAEDFWIQQQKGRNGLSRGCGVPWLLFRWLQEDIETHLLNFWRLCNEKDMEAVCEKKQDEYMSVLYGVALEEIFYRDILERQLILNWKMIQEKLSQVNSFLHDCEADTMSQDSMSKEEKQKFTAWKLRTFSDILSEIGGKLSEESVCLVLDIEVNRNLAVEFQLIMLFDSLNIYSATGQTLEKWLGDLRQGDLIGFFKDNPNRRRVYREIDSYVDGMFLSYWKNVPQEEKNDFPWALGVYFEQLECSRNLHKKADNELMKRAKSIIIQAMAEESRCIRMKN